MQLQLPDLSDSAIQRITVCTYLNSEPPKAVAGDSSFAKCVYPVVNGEGILVLQLDSDDEHDHVHIDVARRDAVPDPPQEWQELKVEAVVSMIEDVLNKYADDSKTCLYLTGRYKVPLSKLPKGGMVQSLLEVSAGSSGAKLELVGTRFAIKDDPTYVEVRWTLESDDENGDTIEATVKAELHMINADGGLLNQSIDVLREGLDRFVFELPASAKSKKKKNGISRKKTS